MALRLLRFGAVNSNRLYCATQYQTVTLTSLRFLDSKRCSTSTPQPRKSLMKSNTAKKISFGILDRFVNYMNRYEAILTNRFPNAMKVYRSFMDGVKCFYIDVKEFLRIVKLLYFTNVSIHNLNRSELELYHSMPKDIMKIAPVLLVSTLPLANYVIFPLIFYFPRQLLTKHFWTIQQRAEFNVLNLRGRLTSNRPVFRHLQSKLYKVPNNAYLRDKWGRILGLLGSGQHPTVAEILECKELFLGRPYHLLYINQLHARHLLQMHDTLGGMFMQKTRLADFAKLLLLMDRAITQEGGLNNLNNDALRYACWLRGLNPTNMSTDDMVKWLTKWLSISEHVDKTCYSLLLHSPILIGYNEPNNWSLIYPHKSHPK